MGEERRVRRASLAPAVVSLDLAVLFDASPLSPALQCVVVCCSVL